MHLQILDSYYLLVACHVPVHGKCHFRWFSGTKLSNWALDTRVLRDETGNSQYCLVLIILYLVFTASLQQLRQVRLILLSFSLFQQHVSLEHPRLIGRMCFLTPCMFRTRKLLNGRGSSSGHISFCILQQLWHDISLCLCTCQLFHANWCWELHDLCTLSWSCSRKMAWCLVYVPWLGEPLAGKDTIFASLAVPRPWKAASYGYVCARLVVNMTVNSFMEHTFYDPC